MSADAETGKAAASPLVTETRELDIVAFAQGGEGIARPAGEPVVFVAGGVPGDRVRAALAPVHRRMRKAELVEVLRPSPWRRDPPCPEAGACGGCQWQHVTPEGQLRTARDLLMDALRRTGRIDVASLEIPEAQSSGSETAYRQRARFHVDLLTEPPRLGYHREGTHDVHDMEHCLVLEPALELLRLTLRNALPRLAKSLQGLANVELSVDLPSDVAAVAQLTAISEQRPDAVRLGEAARALLAVSPMLRGVEVIVRSASGRSELRVAAGEERVPYSRGPLDAPERHAAFLSPGGFMQASRRGNSLLISRVLDACRPAFEQGRTPHVLELFAGNGNFTLPLSAAGAQVLSAESDARAVENARLAAASEGLNLDARCENAEHFVRHLAWTRRRFELIVLDPPRTGAREVVDKLAALSASRVVYVSCDAVTLARDAGILVSGGWRLRQAEPLALFPQTAHFETVATFIRERNPGIS